MDRQLALVREAVPVVKALFAGQSDVQVEWGITRPADEALVAVSLSLRGWSPAARTYDDAETIADTTLGLMIMGRANELTEEAMLRDYYQPCEQAIEQIGWELDEGAQNVQEIEKVVLRVVEARFGRIAV